MTHPDKLGPHHLVRRVSATQIKQFSELHTFLQPGELLEGMCTESFYASNWARASSRAFDPIAAA